MAFLAQELGVAMSGAKGDVDGFKLWQALDPDVVLYTTKQPTIARGENGRYQVAVTQYRQQVQDTVGGVSGSTYKITGGSAVFTLTSAPQVSAEKFTQLTETWRAQLPALDARFPKNPKFVALNTKAGRARVLIDAISGAQNDNTPQDIGTPGGTASFLVDLTPAGAQAWVQGIKQKTNVPSGVEMAYQYLAWLPATGAEVIVYGRRAFDHISAELSAKYQGLFYGGSANIEAAWEKMTRDGTVEIKFIGTPPEGDATFQRELVKTFADEARQRLFESLFVPVPEVAAADAGTTGGFFGGANFALKYKHAEEVTDLKLTIKFEGWTWLNARMDADVTSLFSDLDDSYVTEVNTEQQAVASLLVDSEEKMKAFGGAWTASAGHGPEAPVFDGEGGVKSYIVTADDMSDITVTATGKIIFDEPKFPVISVRQQEQLASSAGDVNGDAGIQMVFKPSQYVGRHDIYLVLLDDDDEVRYDIDEREYLVVNVTYKYTDTFTNPDRPSTKTIKASSKLTPEGPVTFAYPYDPNTAMGEATFSAFGTIGRKVIKAPAQPIDFKEEAVLVMAGPKGIRLVSQAGGEEAGRAGDAIGELGRRIIEGGMRAQVTDSNVEEVLRAASREESLRRLVRDEAARNARDRVVRLEVLRAPREPSDRAGEEITRGGPGGAVREGIVDAIEYTADGEYLWLRDNGHPHRILLSDALSDALDQFDEAHKRVTVRLDESGRVAESIVVKY
jgi:hypothetical protein